MPSNATLKKQIKDISDGLGITTDVKGLKNAQLADLLSGLRKQARTYQYVVADDRVILTRKGALVGGCRILPTDLSGGIEALEALKARGLVVPVDE